LDALRDGSRDHRDRMAVRFLSRLVTLLLLPVPVADARLEQRGRRQGNRRPPPAAEWFLLALIAIHVVAALAHIVIYRDQIMRRMLPGEGV